MTTFTALVDHAVLSIASYGAPEDLLSLASTCRRLGSKIGAATEREWRLMARDAKRRKSSLREWSLMDEAARSVVEESQTEAERACLPLRDGESWMCRYNELLLLRRPLTFELVLGDDLAVSLDHTEAWVEKETATDLNMAVTENVMRAGKHYASFTMTDDGPGIFVGVFRPMIREKERLKRKEPIKDIEAQWGENAVNCCTFGFRNGAMRGWRTGSTLFSEENWLGRGRGLQQNDVAGLLLDLDEGTLTVYINGRRQGILQEVLRVSIVGEFSWEISNRNIQHL